MVRTAKNTSEAIPIPARKKMNPEAMISEATAATTPRRATRWTTGNTRKGMKTANPRGR
jgi:hypothetical protein